MIQLEISGVTVKEEWRVEATLPGAVMPKVGPGD